MYVSLMDILHKCANCVHGQIALKYLELPQPPASYKFNPRTELLFDAQNEPLQLIYYTSSVLIIYYHLRKSILTQPS